MPSSKLWLLNSDGKVFTLSPHSQHIEELTCATQGVSEFKRLAAVPQSTWALGSDHQLYIFVPSSDIPIRVQEVTCENERWVPGVGWSGKMIFPKARRNWSDIRGYGSHPKESFCLPTPNWEWEGEWQVYENMGGEVSGLVGWQYAVSWLGTFSAQMSWNSYVRRRKWVRYRRYIPTDSWAQVPTLGEEMADHQEPFLDVSVGGQDLPTQLEGQLSVWAISITGQVYVREGVSLDCPEGVTWRCIQTGDSDTGVIEVSVSPRGQVWVVVWDGQVQVRVGVSSDMIYGSGWVVIPYPPEHPILQVSVGLDSVWALSREGKIWFWKERESLKESSSSDHGNWIEMVGEMALLSVGANNQVFAIGLSDTSVCMRTSVSPDLLTGKTWQPLTILEPSSRQSRGSFDSSFSSYSGQRSLVGMESSSSMPNFMKANIIPIPKTTQEITDGTKCVKEKNTAKATQDSTVSNINQNNIANVTSQAQDDETLNTNQSDESVIKHTVQVDVSTNSEQKSPKMTENLDQTGDNAMQYLSGSRTPKKCDSSDMHDGTPVNSSASGDHVDGINFDSLNSNTSKVVDFVTDLLGDEEKTDICFKEETYNFVTDLLAEDYRDGPLPDLDISITHTDVESDQFRSITTSIPAMQQEHINSENGSLFIPNNLPDQENKDKPSFYIEQESTTNAMLDVPGSELNRSSSSRSFLDSERSISAVEVNMNWIWLSAAACSLDTASILPWTQSFSDTVSEGKDQLDPSIRQKIFERLRRRNKELSKFSHYEDAVEKTVWMKRGQLQLLVDHRRQTNWLDCVVELEQGVNTNISRDSMLFLHYTLVGKQMHSQISLADVVCVCRTTDTGNRSTFAIFLPDGVEAKRRPYTLCAATEKETNDWISTVAVACSAAHGSVGPMAPSAIWSVTCRGDVLVHHPPTPQPVPLPYMYWCPLGGHLRIVETNSQGITWAVGYDNTAYVYSGGFGGGIFKGVSGASEDVYPQSDIRQMFVFENQKWHILTGFSPRHLLSNKYAWTDESGKIPITKEAIKLPSSNWQWLGDWSVDFSSPGGVDADGWQYSSAYQKSFHGHKGWADNYRKRRWVRKCKLVTSGPWLAVGPTPIIDLSVQPVGQGDSEALTTAIWAVGANGDALCRLGVAKKYPQGDSWLHVPADQPFMAVSMGGNCWLWTLARDASVWFRSGVTHDNPTGTAWLQVVPSPPGGSALVQISVGKQSVWAVDANKTLWRRREASIIFPEGTNWDLVGKHVHRVSVGPDDQVWAVRDSLVTKKGSMNGVISRRTGISESKPVGTGWEDGIGGGWQHICVKGLKPGVTSQTTAETKDENG